MRYGAANAIVVSFGVVECVCVATHSPLGDDDGPSNPSTNAKRLAFGSPRSQRKRISRMSGWFGRTSVRMSIRDGRLVGGGFAVFSQFRTRGHNARIIGCIRVRIRIRIALRCDVSPCGWRHDDSRTSTRARRVHVRWAGKNDGRRGDERRATMTSSRTLLSGIVECFVVWRIGRQRKQPIVCMHYDYFYGVKLCPIKLLTTAGFMFHIQSDAEITVRSGYI